MLLLARAAGGGDAAQAAFAATLSAVNLVSAATRFLVSGVSAQAGAAAARKRRSLLAARARVAVVAAAAIGLFAAGLLVAARRPAFTALGLSRSAADAAAPYWAWRAAAIPPALLAQAAQGVLQGCGWLGTAAGLAVLGSLAEAGAALVVLRPATVATSTTTHPPTRPLPALGRAALAVACLYAAAALAAAARAVACVPNTGGRGSRAASQASLNTPLVEGGGGGGGGEGAPPLLPSWRALAYDFVSGSLAMFVRSITLQLTFFLGVVVASRRGTASLAAHGVVHTLWMLAAHALDGAETAATVLGCRVSALGEEEEGEDDEDCHLPPATRVATAAAAHACLTARCVGGSAVAGAAIGAAIQACSPQIITTFLRPGAKARDLLAGGPISVLALAQVVNGPAYAMDGLLASLSLFRGGAVVILVGFVCVYAPLLACVAGSSSTQVIAGIWGAKLALNCVRVGGGLAVVKREWARRGVVAAGVAAVA